MMYVTVLSPFKTEGDYRPRTVTKYTFYYITTGYLAITERNDCGPNCLLLCWQTLMENIKWPVCASITKAMKSLHCAPRAIVQTQYKQLYELYEGLTEEGDSVLKFKSKAEVYSSTTYSN